MTPDAKRRIFGHESLQDRKSIKAYLKAMTDGVSKGVLSLADNANEITLSPDGMIRLNVEVQGERNRRKLLITLDWKEEDESVQIDPGTLVISAD